MADKSLSPKTLHERANAAYLTGDYQTAIKLQKQLVEQHTQNGKAAVNARKLLALYFYSAKDLDSAIKLLLVLSKEQPEDAEILENLGVMMRQCGRFSDAVDYLKRAGEMAPEKFNVFDGLAHCFHTLKQPDEVQRYGRKSLELKDQHYKGGQCWPIPDGKPPAFNEKNPDRNVISFSLFGNDPRYLHGALRNIRIAADLYPSWVCRFYCDPLVPPNIISEMKQLGCQVVMKPKPINFYEGLLWRFEVVDDPTIDRFLVRDCDSVVNIKERVAVDEWIASDKWFHLMRDFSSHTELILAGMWGGVSGVLPSLEELDDLYKPNTAATRTYDQHLLREMVWPTIRQSVLIHDSVFTGCLDSVAFPEVGQLPANRHIGQNEAAVISADKMMFSNKPSSNQSDQQRFIIFGPHLSGVDYLQQLLNSHPQAHCPPRHQLNAIPEITNRAISRYENLLSTICDQEETQRVGLNRRTLGARLYQSWLEQLFDCDKVGVTHYGIADSDVDKDLAKHAKLLPGLKFIFVVRDPRDIAISIYQYKKNNDPGFDRDGSQMNMIAKSVGEQWVQKIRNVQRYNKLSPGQIELLRYEDLVDLNKRELTLRRVVCFLGLDDSIVRKLFTATKKPNVESVGEWKDALSLNQINLVELVAGELMKLLQYSLSSNEHRAVETDGTILPS